MKGLNNDSPSMRTRVHSSDNVCCPKSSNIILKLGQLFNSACRWYAAFVLLLATIPLAMAQTITPQEKGMCALVAATSIGSSDSTWACTAAGVPAADPCGWTGVTCNQANFVEYLDIFIMELTGVCYALVFDLNFCLIVDLDNFCCLLSCRDTAS